MHPRSERACPGGEAEPRAEASGGAAVAGVRGNGRRDEPPWTAWAVHLYTASGAVVALFALRAFVAGAYRTGFFWLAAATVIDATDGWLARRVASRSRTPQIDGALLDTIVDYLTYVFVPAYVVSDAGLVPDRWSAVIAGVMLLSSAYGFSHREAKSPDHFFRGFPSYWNVAVLYLYAAGTGSVVNTVILLLLCGLVFAPIGCVYPSRTPTLRRLTVALTLVWGGMMLWLIAQLPAVSSVLLASSLSFPAYYVVLSVVLHRRRARAADAAGRSF